MKSLGELLTDRLAIATAPSRVGPYGTPTKSHPMWVGHKDADSFRLWHLVVASLSIQNLSTAKTSAYGQNIRIVGNAGFMMKSLDER
jgi:hypothetical protein